jgi:mannose-1-phosphate guanylyltransferase/mannose-6-phosphate isomerase
MTADKIVALNKPEIIPVILCGGSGTRLWPLSQKEKPKQLLPLVNKTILLHDTLQRIQGCLKDSLPNLITITTENLKDETKFQLESFHPDCATHLLSEPESKNTAAAIAYASLYAKEKFGENTKLWILPADHYVEDHEALKAFLGKLRETNIDDKIITFGIPPTSPDTGYGYIQYNIEEPQDIKKVISFKEKPDSHTAQTYLDSKDHYWNSGMFLTSTKTLLNELVNHAPEIISSLHGVLNTNHDLTAAYEKIPNISFDYAVMEKTDKSFVIEADMGWSDVGSWQSLWEIKSKDAQGNVFEGSVAAHNTENCYIKSDNLMVATLGLKDVVIVENENQILIADKNNTEYLKKISESALTPSKNSTIKEALLEKGKNYSIKKITLAKNQETELHYHQLKSEQLIVLNGSADITIDDQTDIYKSGNAINIPPSVFHKIKNSGDTTLEILEIHQAKKFKITDYYIADRDIIQKVEKA